MHSFPGLLQEINGNGYTEAQVVDITSRLTKFVLLREQITAELADLFDSEDLLEILTKVDLPTYQQQIAANLFTTLSKREKQVFLMRAVENKTFSQISEELGIARGTVQVYVTRSAKKLKIWKEGIDI